MKRSVVETLLGALVLAIAAFFLVFSYRTADIAPVTGYPIYADFAGIGGLKTGDNVLISGVKVGNITSVELVPDSYLARVNMDIDSDIKLPVDTAALISSESLLGGRYLALEPGADDQTIQAGGRVQYTQAPQNLEQLLGQFIFSMKDGKDKQADEQESSPSAPAPQPVQPQQQPAPAQEEALPAHP